jgi:nucleoside-diphosphate-sugar epimerase
MKVFVTGATGTIGFAVSTAFRRAGHQVWGLARSAEKAAVLARAEIHPVVGEIGSPETFAAAAESCSVLVHAAAQYGPGAFAFERSAVHALLAAARRRGPQPKVLL